MPSRYRETVEAKGILSPGANPLAAGYGWENPDEWKYKGDALLQNTFCVYF